MPPKKRFKAEKGKKNIGSLFSPSGELNKSGEADTDTASPHYSLQFI